jgi:hypothetical protein
MKFLVGRKDMTPYYGPLPSEKKNQKPRFLEQTTTGRVYAYTAILGTREDMIPYDGPVPAIPVKEPAKSHESQPPGNVNQKPDTQKSTKVHIGECVNQSEMITNDNTEGVVNPEKPHVQDLAKLNPDERILQLRSEGKSLSFIGKFLGITKVAVHKRLKRIAKRQAKGC